MNKRFFSLLLCCAFALTAALPVWAAKQQPTPTLLTIDSAEEFLQFTEHCRLDRYSQNLQVTLQADIDLSGTGFAGVPIFCGSFEGDGHTIAGLEITAEGTALGLFRYLTADAVVQNLTVEGQVTPEGSRSRVGGIAGENAGLILNCRFAGTVSGGDRVGGIAGRNTVTGIIQSCHTAGDVHGNHFVGGIAGDNTGVVRSCENTAAVNTTEQQNTVELGDITLDTLTNAEATNTVTDIGGIAGVSSGVLRECTNRGEVGYRQMGYNIGGIAGTQNGYITGCENYAPVQGRKEVGGIVGQLEPATVIEYSADTLQILDGQLNTMSGLVTQAGANAQTNAGQISSQLSQLQDQTQTARDALAALTPDPNAPQPPDEDAILAAQNSLGAALDAMPGTISGIAVSTQNTVTGLGRDLQAISGQMNAMRKTLDQAEETLGGSVKDVSDADTPKLLTGKVELCRNSGAVLADLNVGGIAGAMAMENDLDIWQDWQQSGDSSLNFSGEVRAVVLGCENHGTVTAKKQNCGGIVGWQSLGLVSNCSSTGLLDSEGADYVGGIAGQSAGYIRSCYSKCELWADSYAGGIAGSAAVATDCRSLVLLYTGTEAVGEVLGSKTEPTQEVEKPIDGNLFVSAAQHLGGIDGISYAGQAEPLTLEEFLALENLPGMFRLVQVHFLFADGTKQSVSVELGSALDAAAVPPLPQRQGFLARWAGLEQAELDCLLYDLTFCAEYLPLDSVLKSTEEENSRPLLLAQGGFTDRAVLQVEPCADTPAVQQGEQLLRCLTVHCTEPDGMTGGRLLLPDGADADRMTLLRRTADGSWQPAEAAPDGSYLVFSLQSSDSALALVQAAPAPLWPWAAGGAVLLAAAAALLHRRKRAKAGQKAVAD